MEVTLATAHIKASGCGTEGIVIAFNTGGPEIKSSHWQFFQTLNLYELCNERVT